MSTESKQEFHVGSDDTGIRLDRWFKRRLPHVPHAMLQKALRKGLVRVDGKKAETSTRLETGQRISCRLDFAALEPAQETKLKPVQALSEREIKETQRWVIHKDPYLIAINKPAGLAVQGGSGLKDYLDRRLPALQFEAKETPKLVHRLDRDTSGVLLLARSANAAAELSKKLRGHHWRKIYWALAMGVPHPLEGEIESRLEKSEAGEGKQKVRSHESGQGSTAGKKAVTAYRVLEHLTKKLCWLELEPITGRTHQLRVHMAEFGHPILGDGKYGGKDAFLVGMQLAKQLHLHARAIDLQCFGNHYQLEAPLPPHMKQTFSALGFAA